MNGLHGVSMLQHPPGLPVREPRPTPHTQALQFARIGLELNFLGKSLAVSVDMAQPKISLRRLGAMWLRGEPKSYVNSREAPFSSPSTQPQQSQQQDWPGPPAGRRTVTGQPRSRRLACSSRHSEPCPWNCKGFSVACREDAATSCRHAGRQPIRPPPLQLRVARLGHRSQDVSGAGEKIGLRASFARAARVGQIKHGHGQS